MITLLGVGLQGVWTDFAPADNNLTINLITGTAITN